MSHYTWIEDDVPEKLTLANPRPSVLKSIEESVRYGIHEPEAYHEWLWTSTVGDAGNVHLGPNHRLFVPVFSHEMHCLRVLRGLLEEAGSPEGGPLHHAEHCLSFLRQHILCAAESALERGDVFARNFTSDRLIGERTCLDSEAYYETMSRLWKDWLFTGDRLG